MGEQVDKARVLKAAREQNPGAYVYNPPKSIGGGSGGGGGGGSSNPSLDDDFFRNLIESRTDETGRTWVKIGAGLVVLGVIGSVGTFSRLARKSFSSGIPSNALANPAGGPTGLASVAVMEKQAQAMILRDRIQELQKRLKERHPLWYPGDQAP